eukprot:TRINITY_DN14312_c0_g1_i1.p1 TRINITY_DN14312_c0_g1~~TRINITY_DN14312_c0_g1_i1.p1  ORF type:complete len:300 (+),score=43.32 TRINITY_DN14312_c0_g1_i1:103-1002(+)
MDFDSDLQSMEDYSDEIEDSKIYDSIEYYSEDSFQDQIFDVENLDEVDDRMSSMMIIGERLENEIEGTDNNEEISPDIFDDFEDSMEISPIKNYSYNYVPFPKKLLSHIPNQDLERLISACHEKKDYPFLISLENMKEYYSNTSEHPFLYEINNYKNEPIPKYNSSFLQSHFKVPGNVEGMKRLVNEIIFHKDVNVTKEQLSLHEAFHKDCYRETINLTKISKNLIPSPHVLYYCDDDSHPRDDNRFKKGPVYYFYKPIRRGTPTCTVCNRRIAPSSYFLIYKAKEAIHFHLFKLSEQE